MRSALRELELLQRRRAEIGVKAFAIDRNGLIFGEVRSGRNLVVLVAFIAFEFSELHARAVLFFRKLASSSASFAAIKITWTSGPLDVLKFVRRRTSFPSCS